MYRFVTVIILAAFVGCTSSKVMYVESGKLPKDNSYDILSVTMRNSESIDLRNRSAVFHEEYKGRKLVITYNEGNTEKIIAITNISQVKIEVYNERGSIAIAFGGLLFIGFLVWMANRDFGD